MGQQYNKVIKRRRRMAYNVRKVAAQAAAVKAKTTRPRPVRSAAPSPASANVDETTTAAAPAPAKRVRKPKEPKAAKAENTAATEPAVNEDEGSVPAAEAAPTTSEGNEV